MPKKLRAKSAFSLLETIAVIAVVSVLSVPLAFFISEKTYGKAPVNERYEVLSMLESRLEAALNMPYKAIKQGKTSDKIITCSTGQTLDLRPAAVFGRPVYFELTATASPLSVSALNNIDIGETAFFNLENSLKRLEITARWGENKKTKSFEQTLSLVAYKADL